MIVANKIKYKETGVDFVPVIPENWNFLKLRHIGSLYSGLSGKSGKDFQIENSKNRYVPFTSISNDIVVNLEKLSFVKINDGENQNLVVKDDILFLMSSETQDDIGKAAIVLNDIQNVYLNSFCKGFRINDEEIDPKFLIYALNSENYRNHFKIEGKGFTRINLKQYAIKNLAIAFPPFQTQQQIASFLDHKCEQINRFINNKIEFIRILKEQRQSVIDRAVTKGIKSNVDLISSGYDFIGDIPKHWKIKRLGVLGSFSKGGNISRAELLYDTVGINAILYGDIYTKYDIQAKNIINQISKKTADKAIKVYYDDLLFTGSGETKEDIGKCVVVKCKEEVYAGGDVIIFRQEDNDSHFIAYSQNSSFAKYQKAISSKGDIIVHTYGSKLKNVVMPYPEIEEQKEIVKYIKEETKNIDELITKAEKEIILIKEYKESLISHAVTGQLQNIYYKK